MHFGIITPIAIFIACKSLFFESNYTKGDVKMIKKVCSNKPGVYRRRQEIYKGYWVDFLGFLFLPIGKGYRKWVGLAQVKLTAAPQPIPTQYVKHSQNHAKPYKIDYIPISEGKK